jgi:hypothetical protein
MTEERVMSSLEDVETFLRAYIAEVVQNGGILLARTFEGERELEGGRRVKCHCLMSSLVVDRDPRVKGLRICHDRYSYLRHHVPNYAAEALGVTKDDLYNIIIGWDNMISPQSLDAHSKPWYELGLRLRDHYMRLRAVLYVV